MKHCKHCRLRLSKCKISFKPYVIILVLWWKTDGTAEEVLMCEKSVRNVASESTQAEQATQVQPLPA